MYAYQLHYFPESGNSYKLALMLTLCGETFEPIWTDFGSGITWMPVGSIHRRRRRPRSPMMDSTRPRAPRKVAR